MKSKRSKVYWYSSSQSNLPHCYGNSHAIQDHTVLPATRQRWHSRLYPSRSWYSKANGFRFDGLSPVQRHHQVQHCFSAGRVPSCRSFGTRAKHHDVAVHRGTSGVWWTEPRPLGPHFTTSIIVAQAQAPSGMVHGLLYTGSQRWSLPRAGGMDRTGNSGLVGGLECCAIVNEPKRQRC